MKKVKKIKKLFSLKESTVKAIEELAKQENRKFSTIVDLAIEFIYKKKQD